MRLVTLLELLKFGASGFVEMQRCLTLIGGRLLPYERTGWLVGFLLRRGRRQEFVHLKADLDSMRSYFAAMDLTICVGYIDSLLGRLIRKEPVKAHHIANLQENLEHELRARIFLAVSADRQKYFDEPLGGWESVIRRFPDAQQDIEEMSKCFALSRYNASVFHSLLVVEHALVALGTHIGVTDHKVGWDATYTQLNRLINNRASVAANMDFNFLEQTKARLDSMKLAWRNKVNHAAGRLMIEKSGFTDISAEEVIIACRSFMRHLADGLPK